MTLHYEDAGLRLFHGSNRDILPTLPDASYDSIVTDPPYELGFMGKGWDSSGIAYDVDVWRECFRVLKPGGYMLAFGGTRTWHRIAVAIEDAGFEIRDSIAWMYGSGFPKSLDVAQAIDKLDAAEERLARAREFQVWLREHLSPQRVNELTGTDMGHHLTTHPTQPAIATSDLFDRLRSELPAVPERIEELVAQRTVESKNFAAREVVGQHRSSITRGTSGVTAAGEGKARTRSHTAEAASWEGWGTALKPAFEPIIVARKPLAGTVAANVLAYGTGALNIDACRVETTENLNGGAYSKNGGRSVSRSLNPSGMNREGATAHGEYVQPSGRFPSNVLLDESQAAELDRQAPDTGGSGKASGPTRTGGSKSASMAGAFNGTYAPAVFYGDRGGASRFFPTFRYVAKAPGTERPEVDGVAHATVKPLDLMRWLVRLVTRRGGHVLDLYAGSGTTGEAALLEGMECTLIELEADHLPLILARVRKPLQPSMFGDWEEAS
ncbi:MULTISPECIES: DNA methyltransferase [Microbacterium]|uniref:DNA methyltransferase n=1 Tax=Microbacterium TaxID=33882 RepID=UPI0026E945F4|nr:MULTISPECIES: DNA methyltransferase [Microbacterium]